MADGTLNFAIGLENDDLERKAKASMRVFEEIGNKAVAEGKRIDEAFQKIRDEKLSTIDTSTTEGRLNALREVISNLENDIALTNKQIEEYGEKAKEAFANNDTKGLEAYTNNIVAQQKALTSQMTELERYKAALNEIKKATGDIGNLDFKEPNLWFKKQKTWEEAEKTKKKIEDLKAAIATLDPSDKGYDKLNTQLQESQEHLDNLRDKAAYAASELGDNLGSKVASASEQYYILNKALEEQTKRYEEAAKAKKAAERELDRARDSKDENRIKAASLAYKDAAQNFHEAARAQNMLAAETQDAKEKLDGFTGGTLAKLLGGTKNYQTVINALPASLQSVITGIAGMTKSAMAFIATPLGAILGAIVLALKAVQTALSSTEEGQMRLARASGYLKGVLTVLRGIVVKVGNAIIDMVEKPQEKIQELGDRINKYILEPIQGIWKALGGLGSVVSAMFKGEWDKIPALFETIKDQLYDAVKPINDAGTAFFNKAKDTVNQTGKVKELQEQMRIEEEKWAIRKHQLEADAEEKRTEATDTSLPIQQRKKAFEDYKKLLDAIYQEEASFANRRVMMQRSVLSMSNTAENRSELRRLQAEAAKIQAEYTRQQRTLQRTANTLAREELTYINTVADNALALRRKRQQDEIDLMKDGLEKTLRQMKLNYDKELDEIEKQKRDTEQKQKAALDMYQRNEYFQRMKSATDKYNAMVKNALDQELNNFRSYNEQRERIAKEYAQKIEALYQHDENGNRTTLREGVTAEHVANIQADERKQQSALDSKELKESAEYAKLFSSYLVIGADEVRRISEKVKKDLNRQLQDGNITIEQWAKGMEEVDNIINKATDSMGELRSFLDGGIAGLAQYRQLLGEQRINSSSKDLEQAKRDYDKAIADGNKAAADVAQQQIEAAEAEIKAGEEMRDTATAMLDAVNAAKAVLDICVKVGDTMSVLKDEILNVAESFGVETDSLIADIVSVSFDAVSHAMGAGQKLLSGDVFGALQELIRYVSTIITGINGIIDGDLERSIKKHMMNVEGLEKNYEDLEKAINKAYGSSKAELIREQEENLRQQIAELEQARKEEEDKKNTDEDKTKKYDEQIDQRKEKLADLHDAEKAAIFGSDIQSAIESLADALVDAWGQGSSAAEAFKDFARQQTRDMLNNYVRDYISKMTYAADLRKRLEDAMSDGNITDEEWNAINTYAEESGKKIEEALAPVIERIKAIEDEEERRGATKGIAQASQDSVDELNGRFTVIQGHTFALKESTSSIADSTARLLAVSNDILGTVRHIDTTTTDMHTLMGGMADEMNIMRRSLSHMELEGIRLKK